MEKHSNSMATWRRPHRVPSVRNIAILCALFLLLNHLRVWSIDYQVSSTSPVYTQSSEALEASAEIPTEPPAEETAETPADIPADTPAEAPPVPQLHMPEPAAEPTGIPKKIWYKLGAKGLSSDARGWTNTCITQNPEYHAEFLTDKSADEFVSERYADRPDIVETYLALTVPILKADLLRYLLLYAEGGVWFDLDVSCEGIPIDEWVPEEFMEDPSLVVGWEFDAGYHFHFQRQFTTWAVMAKKGVPHLMTVVDDILQSMADVAKANNATISQLSKGMVGDIVDFTGPKRFAKSVATSLESSLALNNQTGEADEWEGWDAFHELLEPKLAGDVLVLPGYSLAASFNTYEEEDQERVGPSLVIHHYAGTWKNDYGGERLEEQDQPL
ncbi:hypothetical protein Daus18300_001166 [Diaporthe australafricana]|uniref:Initiation-specific alpha-1,6-mannosyltransferase n=1 Tax=Diaporthe australafricana TaxID=127596 RepID=A0ABR3XZ72_9PEZI